MCSVTLVHICIAVVEPGQQTCPAVILAGTDAEPHVVSIHNSRKKQILRPLLTENADDIMFAMAFCFRIKSC